MPLILSKSNVLKIEQPIFENALEKTFIGCNSFCRFYPALAPLVRERGRKIFDFSGVSVDLSGRKRQNELHPFYMRQVSRE